MRSYPVKESPISSAVSEIICTNRQIDIVLLCIINYIIVTVLKYFWLLTPNLDKEIFRRKLRSIVWLFVTVNRNIVAPVKTQPFSAWPYTFHSKFGAEYNGAFPESAEPHTLILKLGWGWIFIFYLNWNCI